MTLANATIVLADEEPEAMSGTARALRAAGIDVKLAPTGAKVFEFIERQSVDVVVTSDGLRDCSGPRLVHEIAERSPGLPVIVLSPTRERNAVVQAMKAGAADFLHKPVDDDELRFAVEKALATVEALVGEPPPSRVAGATNQIVGRSVVLRKTLATLHRAARSSATVLIRGESGTGKELVARQVHDQSARRHAPFVKVHCAALPDNLLESELFGYEKGAFTGAASRKPGRVELASGGTLFLDEIGDITPATQVKLLRVLQDKQYERLGGTETLDADVRFVAATHRDLEAMVKAGTFRQDLYYRLNVLPIVIAPLRRRPEDIEPLVRHFGGIASAANGRPSPQFDPEAMAIIERYRWPGNVRQLQNFVERIVVMSDTKAIHAEDVKDALSHLETGLHVSSTSKRLGTPSPESAVVQLDEAVRRAERKALEKALAKAGGNRSLAARLLGVSRRTLYNKLQEHGVA